MRPSNLRSLSLTSSGTSPSRRVTTFACFRLLSEVTSGPRFWERGPSSNTWLKLISISTRSSTKVSSHSPASLCLYQWLSTYLWLSSQKASRSYSDTPTPCWKYTSNSSKEWKTHRNSWRSLWLKRRRIPINRGYRSTHSDTKLTGNTITLARLLLKILNSSRRSPGCHSATSSPQDATSPK